MQRYVHPSVCPTFLAQQRCIHSRNCTLQNSRKTRGRSRIHWSTWPYNHRKWPKMATKPSLVPLHRSSIRPLQVEWWRAGVVICQKRGVKDLHMVQLMPLLPNLVETSGNIFIKIQNCLSLLCRLTQTVLENRPLNGCLTLCNIDKDHNTTALQCIGLYGIFLTRAQQWSKLKPPIIQQLPLPPFLMPRT